MAQNIVIFGATSAIAHETAKHFAQRGAKFALLGRNENHLKQIADDLKVRGASATSVIAADLANCSLHNDLWQQAVRALGDVDLAFYAHGYLGTQSSAEASVDEALKVFHVNAVSYLTLLGIAANYFEARRKGCIAVITSVAGDRGRKSNYIYGSSKAAIIALLQGMRNRLFAANVSVIDIRPGFIDTPMTKHIEKKPLVATAHAAGKIIFDGITKGCDVIYVPFRWKIVMTIIKSIPERIFKRLNL